MRSKIREGARRRVLARLAVASSLLEAAPARAEEPEPKPEPIVAQLDVVRGFRTAFEIDAEGEELGEPKESQALSLLGVVRVPIGRRWRVGARAPLTTATFLFSERLSRKVTALGNLELSAARAFELGPLESELELGVALPTATGDENADERLEQGRGYANLAAQRFRGYLDNALFAAHRFGVVPAWTLRRSTDWLSWRTLLKLELLADAGVSPPPPGLGEINGTAVELVAGGEVEVAPFEASRVFRFALASWVAWTVVGDVKQPDRPEGEEPAAVVQPVVAPSVRMLSGRLTTSVTLVVPAGGLLGRTGYLAGRFVVGVDF